MSNASSTTDTTYNASSLFNAINKANGRNADGTKISNGANKEDATELQNQFLTLLTAQLQNQDPLNPLENTELTSQLAQINTVSGIAGISEKITSLMTALNNNQGIQAANIIGKNILTSGNQLTLTSEVDENGTPIAAIAYGGIQLESDADKVLVTITDGVKEIQTIDLGRQKAGIVSFAWDGMDNSGNLYKDGKYKFNVHASQNDNLVLANPMQYSPVYAISRDVTGNFVLDLGEKGTIALNDVQQIL